MLLTKLVHPEILSALGGAGHGSRVLIADGNYPVSTTAGKNAKLVYLNLMPGVITATQALEAVVSAVPIEAAHVMEPMSTGPYAMSGAPQIWSEFESIMRSAGVGCPIAHYDRQGFYEAVKQDDVCLVIATGEKRIYANILLTLGVRRD
ncbi:RbsD or FucU transport [Pelomyxa schiedti]|nr:RbsD or FucU transport [Pelomyxa schiedti]